MLALVTAAALLSTPVATASPGFEWHDYGDDQVQYGIPETDDRLVNLGCASPGMIWLSVPAHDSSRTAWINGQPHEGEIVHRGDGDNLEVVLSVAAEPIQRLASGEGVTVRVSDVGWTVPGGAGALIQALIERCPVG